MTVYVKEFKSEIAFWIADRFEYSAFCQPLDFDWPFSFFQVIKYMVWCSNLLLLNLEWNIQLFCSYMEDHMFRWLISIPCVQQHLHFETEKIPNLVLHNEKFKTNSYHLLVEKLDFVLQIMSNWFSLFHITEHFALSNKIIDGTLCNSHAVLSFGSWWQTLIRVTAFFVFTP